MAKQRHQRTVPKPIEPTLNDIPRWVPPTVFAVITVVLFREFLVGGKLLGTDTMAASYFGRHFYQTFVAAFHRFPLWDPLLYGGLPFIDAMHGDTFYPVAWLQFILPLTRALGIKLILHEMWKHINRSYKIKFLIGFGV